MNEAVYYFSSTYFGSVALFFLLAKNKDVRLEQCETYQKKSYRNRLELLGSNGLEMLTIPLKAGKNKQQFIKDVQISYEDDWIKKHVHSLCSYYGTAGFFEHYFPEIKAILDKRYKFLWDFNLASLEWSADAIGLKHSWTMTQDYHRNPKYDCRKPESQINKFLDTYLASNLNYAQVYEYKFQFKYTPSILDLLFCTGPESLIYLSSVPDFSENLPSNIVSE